MFIFYLELSRKVGVLEIDLWEFEKSKLLVKQCGFLKQRSIDSLIFEGSDSLFTFINSFVLHSRRQ